MIGSQAGAGYGWWSATQHNLESYTYTHLRLYGRNPREGSHLTKHYTRILHKQITDELRRLLCLSFSLKHFTRIKDELNLQVHVATSNM